MPVYTVTYSQQCTIQRLYSSMIHYCTAQHGMVEDIYCTENSH